jgi:hypothetical protein
LNIRDLTFFVFFPGRVFPDMLRCVVLVGIESPEYRFNGLA